MNYFGGEEEYGSRHGQNRVTYLRFKAAVSYRSKKFSRFFRGKRLYRCLFSFNFAVVAVCIYRGKFPALANFVLSGSKLPRRSLGQNYVLHFVYNFKLGFAAHFAVRYFLAVRQYRAEQLRFNKISAAFAQVGGVVYFSVARIYRNFVVFGGNFRALFVVCRKINFYWQRRYVYGGALRCQRVFFAYAFDYKSVGVCGYNIAFGRGCGFNGFFLFAAFGRRGCRSFCLPHVSADVTGRIAVVVVHVLVAPCGVRVFFLAGTEKSACRKRADRC